MIGNLINIVNDVLEPHIKNTYRTETVHAGSEWICCHLELVKVYLLNTVNNML